jgi:hypothetical protein
MALVTQRIWRAGPRKVKHAAWGFTGQRDGKQVRRFREDWTKEDAERALSEWTLGVEAVGTSGDAGRHDVRRDGREVPGREASRG